MVGVTNFKNGTFSYFIHNVNEFLILVHGSYHISLSILQIDVSPDTGNVEDEAAGIGRNQQRG